MGKKLSKQQMDKALAEKGWEKKNGYRLDINDVDDEYEVAFFENPEDILTKCVYYAKDDVAFDDIEEVYDYEFGEAKK